MYVSKRYRQLLFCQCFDFPHESNPRSAPYDKDQTIVECFSVHWTAYWISALDPIYTLSSDFRVVVLTIRFNLLPKVFLRVVYVEQASGQG